MSFLDDYYGNYGGLSAAEYVERYIRRSAIQMERIRETVDLLPKHARTVLDVGAGHGVLLEQLEAVRGVRGVGIEITPSKVDYARSNGIDLRLGTAERLDFEDASFDAVVSCEVLEHLPFGTYERALAELARVARHAVIVSVPNEEERSFLRCPYCHSSVNPNYHIRSFSAESLAGLVPGFRLRDVALLGMHRSSPLLRIGRRLFDSSWPSLLVCAVCGYRAAGAVECSDFVSARSTRFRDAAQRISMLLPARRKATWLVGVFEAGDGAASTPFSGR